MKYYLVAGELSGDLHASNLMRELKNIDKNSDFRYFGGDLMQEHGGTLVKHYREMAFMGFVDVLKNIRAISKNIKLCKSDILEYKPDVLILVDYPGFNLRIAEFAHKKGIKVYYYISPKIWAWKQSRVKKIQAFVDKMFVIFPFEIDFYKQFNYEVEFVGNPLLDALRKDIHSHENFQEFTSKHNLPKKPIIALLPGSRKSEIKHNLEVMLKVSKFFPDFQFVLAAAPSLDMSIYEEYTSGYDVKIIFNETYKILKQAKAAIVTSGTATLETALFNVPQLVCYKGDYISYKIIKALIKIKYASLVNLVMDAEIIKEFLQYDMTEENLKNELFRLTSDSKYISEMKYNYKKMRKILGGTGASLRTAEVIVSSLQKQDFKTKISDMAYRKQWKIFNREDRANDSYETDNLFVGSSSIRRWDTMQEDMSPKKVLNRGFGGSTMRQLLEFHERLILRYTFKKIFVYEGDNDIGKAEEKVYEVLEQFKTLVKIIHEHQPDAEIYFLSIKCSPYKKGNCENYKFTNNLFKEYCETIPYLNFIDIASGFFHENGEINESFFEITDGVHPSPEGYKYLTKLLKPILY